MYKKGILRQFFDRHFLFLFEKNRVLKILAPLPLLKSCNRACFNFEVSPSRVSIYPPSERLTLI